MIYTTSLPYSRTRPSQVERELLKTLRQHSLAQMAGILVDILFVSYYFIYLFYLFIILFIY